MYWFTEYTVDGMIKVLKTSFMEKKRLKCSIIFEQNDAFLLKLNQKKIMILLRNIEVLFVVKIIIQL